MSALKSTYRFLVAFAIGLVLSACVEPFDIEGSESFESALVVEATVTNEEKQQVVRLSRAYPLDSVVPNAESNAQVKVFDDTGSEFVFEETEPGIYVSTQAFAARAGIGYRLSITTAEGRLYGSESQMMAEGSEIDKVYPIREANDFGEDGVTIYLDTQSEGNNSSYFRYEYEETFKIVAPRYVDEDISLVNDQWPDFEYELVKRSTDSICYGNRRSARIVLANTDGQASNKIERFQVKFLNSDDYIISHRYSILIRQHAQSLGAYSYYETLRDFSQAENFFSENQPGFLEGNIVAETDRDEKVIGFFDVSEVTTKRMFFNYMDLFPNEPLPPYVSACSGDIKVAPSDVCSGDGGPGCVPSLITVVQEKILTFFEVRTDDNFNPAPLSRAGPYLMIPFNCGDCTKLGTNTVPDFWEHD